MENIYKTINTVQTHLITWGNPFDCNGSQTDIIVCVTGNPGVPDFYIEFGAELHKTTSLPVCIIGQAGHDEVPDKTSNCLKNQEELFNLEGQLAHKLDFLNNHINRNCKLHLIGHSIGAWLITELLHRNASLLERVSSVNLLFPTLQRMAETRNGKVLNGVIRRIHVFVLLMLTLLYLIPKTVHQLLVGLYLKFNSLPAHYNERILKYLNPKVMEKVLFLAYDEMDTVTALNVSAINSIKHITNIIYSTNDGWAPVTYMDDLKKFQPPMTMIKVGIDHSFVLKSSERVAEMVSESIKIKI